MSNNTSVVSLLDKASKVTFEQADIARQSVLKSTGNRRLADKTWSSIVDLGIDFQSKMIQTLWREGDRVGDLEARVRKLLETGGAE